MFIVLFAVAMADIVPVEEWIVPTTIEPVIGDISPKIIKPTRATKTDEKCECPEPQKIGMIIFKTRDIFLATFECPNGIFKLDIFKMDCLIIVFAVWAVVSGIEFSGIQLLSYNSGIINLIQCAKRSPPAGQNNRSNENNETRLTANDSK